MVSYEDYREDVRRIHKILVNGMLKKVAFQQFENDRGVAVHKVLPDKSSDYTFDSGGFTGYIEPDRRGFHNPTFDGMSVTVSQMAAHPSAFEAIGERIHSLWWETFGENRGAAAQRSHPGDPPIGTDELNSIFESLTETKALLTANPMLEDLIHAFKDRNYRIAAQFLNIEQDPVTLFTPGGEHELTELFTHGDVDIVYQDRDIALLKPQYHHGIRQQVLNQQRAGWERVRLQGEQPELAFVVGRDDTPTGLFVHAVDGTRLDADQEVSRDQIHAVMGFDTNYRHGDPNRAQLTAGRTRLQGDLAVEYVGEPASASDSRCNLPIDNHLCLLTSASVADGDTRDEEPILVDVSSPSQLNIVHDEHDNLNIELPAGRYRFYLLQRGLQQPAERTDW